MRLKVSSVKFCPGEHESRHPIFRTIYDPPLPRRVKAPHFQDYLWPPPPPPPPPPHTHTHTHTHKHTHTPHLPTPHTHRIMGHYTIQPSVLLQVSVFVWYLQYVIHYFAQTPSYWWIKEKCIKYRASMPLNFLLLLISMLLHRQAIFESKGDKVSSSAECRFRKPEGLWNRISADWMPADKPTELLRIKLKTWTWQLLPMISEQSAHSTPLPVGIRTWLWRYTCLLLLISMLWHWQAIFESKGDKFSSSAECRIRTQGLKHQNASRRNAYWHMYWIIIMKYQFSSVIIMSHKSGYVYNTNVFLYLSSIHSWACGLLVSSSYLSYAYTKEWTNLHLAENCEIYSFLLTQMHVSQYKAESLVLGTAVKQSRKIEIDKSIPTKALIFLYM